MQEKVEAVPLEASLKDLVVERIKNGVVVENIKEGVLTRTKFVQEDISFVASLDSSSMRITKPIAIGSSSRINEIEWLGSKFACKTLDVKGRVRGRFNRRRNTIPSLLKQSDMIREDVELYYDYSVENALLETEMLYKLRHRHILQIIGCCEIRNQLRIITELIDDNLENLIKARMKDVQSLISGPFSQAVAMDILCQIARGMLYLHKH